jgi:GT2 family glycosyltransferase
MRVAVVTLVHGRHDHLRGLLGGLRAGSRAPDLLVVAAMDDDGVIRVVRDAATTAETHVVDVPRVEGLPLAAARNAAAHRAIESGADLLVFLDVDCIPSPSLIARYAEVARGSNQPAPVALAGAVHYLPPRGAGQRAYRPEDLRRSAPHPTRPALPPAQTQVADDVRLFWSLSFAMSARDWDRVGGFDEGYVGYGGEDTDFGMRLARAGGSLVWVGDAVAYHQHHPVENPPYRHLDDIVVNANRFWDRWGFSPMEGWLAAFEDAGLVMQSGRPPRWTRTTAAGNGARTA